MYVCVGTMYDVHLSNVQYVSDTIGFVLFSGTGYVITQNEIRQRNNNFNDHITQNMCDCGCVTFDLESCGPPIISIFPTIASPFPYCNTLVAYMRGVHFWLNSPQRMGNDIKARLDFGFSENSFKPSDALWQCRPNRHRYGITLSALGKQIVKIIADKVHSFVCRK